MKGKSDSEIRFSKEHEVLRERKADLKVKAKVVRSVSKLRDVNVYSGYSIVRLRALEE